MHQMLERVVVQIDQQAAVAAFNVHERAVDQVAHVIVGQRSELKDARSANQRADDLEVGVLRRRADQDDRAVFDVRQQRVLLRLVEAVNLVDQQDGALVIIFSRSFDSSTMRRMSPTPDITALICSKWLRVVLAMIIASVVLPVPAVPTIGWRRTADRIRWPAAASAPARRCLPARRIRRANGRASARPTAGCAP